VLLIPVLIAALCTYKWDALSPLKYVLIWLWLVTLCYCHRYLLWRWAHSNWLTNTIMEVM